MRKSEKQKVAEFLKANGWKLNNKTDGYNSYLKDDAIAIDVNEEYMVFLGESGDFLHTKTNLYTLIGVLMTYRQLPFNYQTIGVN